MQRREWGMLYGAMEGGSSLKLGCRVVVVAKGIAWNLLWWPANPQDYSGVGLWQE